MTLSPFISSASIQRVFRTFLALALIAFVASCSSGPRAPLPVIPVPLSIFIQANDKINPDPKGRPSPVKIVVYELKSPTAFESADFFSISQKDQATLGGDLLAKEEFFLQPGTSKTLTRKGNAETNAIGVFVEFRDIDQTVWRAITLVPPAQQADPRTVLKPKSYHVLLNQKGIKIFPL